MKRMRLGRVPSIALAAALVGSAAACMGSGMKPGKSGGSPPEELTLANSDQDLTGVPGVQRFVDRVKQLSNGQVTVAVRSSWGDGLPGYELGVVRDLRRGKADLAWLGTRVFDKAGVRSFQALHAPLLIDSYALEKAVLRSRLPAQMLGGLKPIGLVGLAVLADELRKPFGAKRFLLRPPDYAGVAFRTYDSDVQERAVRVLGAGPTDLGWAGLRQALIEGKTQGMETDLRSYAGNNYGAVAPYMTVNVNLWPRTVALVANASAFAKLTERQQDWLMQAAADAARYSLRLLGNDTPFLADSCAGGGRLRLATARDLAALRSAFRPVYAAIERDPNVRTSIRTIEALKRSVHREALRIPAACTASRAVPTVKRPARTRSLPDGVYRYTITRRDIVRVLPHAPEQLIRNNAGVVTWRFSHGTLTWRQQPQYPTNSGTYGKGLYTVSGDPFVVRWSICDGCPPVETIHWRWDGRLLRLHKNTRDQGDILFWNLKPLVKIG